MDSEHRDALKRALQAEANWNGERRSFVLHHTGGMQSEIDHPGWDPSWAVPSEHTIDDLGELGLLRVAQTSGRGRSFVPTPAGRDAGRRSSEQHTVTEGSLARVPSLTAVLAWLKAAHASTPEAFELPSRLLDQAVSTGFITPPQRGALADRVLELIADGYLAGDVMAVDQATPDQTLAMTQRLRLTVKGDAAALHTETDRPATPDRAQPESDGTAVMVVHGRDAAARNAMFDFLRAIGLRPLEWGVLLEQTGSASPYIGEVLDAAFGLATAVVVLFTPDDEARLLPPLHGAGEPSFETELTPQARPNVLFEAGMAFGSHPKQTVLVELGTLRPFSDVLGRHVVKLNGTEVPLRDIARRLKQAGCAVDLSGDDWARPDRFLLPPVKHPAGSTAAALAAQVADMNEDAQRWCRDRDRLLRDEEGTATTDLSSRGLLDSGAHLRALSSLRTGALQEYRDTFSGKLREYREICRETPRGHTLPRFELTAPSRDIVASWRRPAQVPGMDDHADVYDPTDHPDETELRTFEFDGCGPDDLG